MRDALRHPSTPEWWTETPRLSVASTPAPRYYLSPPPQNALIRLNTRLLRHHFLTSTGSARTVLHSAAPFSAPVLRLFYALKAPGHS